jgi:hypothetical protein
LDPLAEKEEFSHERPARLMVLAPNKPTVILSFIQGYLSLKFLWN